MKYSVEIEIALPRAKVIQLFEDRDRMHEWQDGFVSMEHQSGEEGKVGSTYLLKYKMGRRDVELVETIKVYNFPEEFSATYEAKGVWNEVQNYFSEKGEHATVWKAESEFDMSGIMKLVAFLMPGSFKKQTFKHMRLFKEFAEKQNF